MPGISLVSSSENLDEKKKLILSTLNSLNILDGYTSKTYLFEENLFIGWNKYEKYPIEIFKDGKFTFLIEGKIYNKDRETLKGELINISKKLNDENIVIDLKSWLLTNDGDFIIYLINNELGIIYIINDVFGRLPLYYSKQDGHLVFSRYLKFITEINGDFNFDKMAIAQFLLIGYMLGKRTLFQNIYHVRPASFIKIEKTNFVITTIHEFNFEKREHHDSNFEKNISELSNLFSISCKNRFDESSENIVTLSGGLDSRLIASCMSINNLPFKVATINYESGKAHKEVAISCELSNLYNVPIEIINTPNPQGSDVFDLLMIKEGMVSFATTPILPFYYGIRKVYGNIVQYISGDNGDKIIFTYDKPIKKTNSIQELVKYFMDEYSLYNIEDVCKITSLDKKDIIREFEIILNEFPETDLVQKYIHLKIIEKPFKFAFEGEDRHRHYFWNSSPFWSYPFFNYIMTIPESSKKMHRLFRQLLQSYSKEATNITYTNFRSSINSFKGRIIMWLFFYCYPIVPFKYINKIKTRFFGGNPTINSSHIAKECILKQLETVKELEDYLKKTEIHPLLSKISSSNLYNLLTVTSTIELFLTKRSILNNYCNTEFP